MNESLYIPRRLNDPPKFFVFDLEGAAIVVTGAFLGMVVSQFFLFFIIGCSLSFFYNRAKVGRHPAFALHALYWYFPGKLLKKIPESSIREYIG